MICDYTSKLFYEGKLEPKAGLEQQVLSGPTKYARSRLVGGGGRTRGEPELKRGRG